MSIKLAAANEPLKIVFMGTPEFAEASLSALASMGESIVAVFTREDKPAGRGYKLTPPPVKVRALELGIPVYQPKSLRTPEALELINELAPNLIVVAAYGRILPAEIINYPKYGCINVHGSLLPEYRGAAPMQRAMIEGKKTTGITTMLMDEGIDTGDMLLKAELLIADSDDFGVLHDKMAALGAELLKKTVNALKKGELTAVPQPNEGSTYAAKIEKSDCLIDFSRPVREIFDLIRGCSPFPLAYTHTPDGKLLKIVCAIPADGAVPDGAACGEIVALSDKADKNDTDAERAGSVTVVCGDGLLAIKRLLPEGKGRMSAADAVRGRRLLLGMKLC